MKIINNNNNNDYGYNYGQPQYGMVDQIPPSPADSMKFLKGDDRESMIYLSKYFGWSGWHYFHFGKPFLGIIHLLFSLIGIAAAFSVVFILILADDPVQYLIIALGLIPALLISILSGVICSFYWTYKDDETFRMAYPGKKQKSAENKDNRDSNETADAAEKDAEIIEQ